MNVIFCARSRVGGWRNDKGNDKNNLVNAGVHLQNDISVTSEVNTL